MRKLLIILPVVLVASCKTNPPTVPFDNRIAGKIFVSANFNFNPQSKAVNKVVLLEDFANVSCVPCVTSNKIIETLSNETYGKNKLIAVKYPTNFPAPNDLFYLANKSVCDSLIKYYNVLFAPTTLIDGINRPSSLDSLELKQNIDERLALTPSFEISIDDEFTAGSFYVNIDVNLLAPIDLTNLVLRIIIIEDEIEFQNPPGSNGETKFFNIMREVLPSTAGISLPEVQQSGLHSIELEGAVKAAWQSSRLKAVVFVQNTLTKEVLQAAGPI